MAFPAYLYVKAERGELKGFTGEDEKCADGKTVRDMCRVRAVNHSVHIPTNRSTAEPIGTSNHSPLLVTIELDRSVAELYKCMSENGRILEAKLYFFRSGAGPRGGGNTDELLHNWFTITLNDARIVGMDLRKPLSMGGESSTDLLDVTFSYYKIGWEDSDEKKVAEYAWNQKTGKA